VRASGVKFAMPGRSFSGARWPFWYSCSDTSKGRQVIRSAAVPALSFFASTSLYSAGGVGTNFTLMFGCDFSNVGMILSRQTGRSS
jgi:hypothetical protein